MYKKRIFYKCCFFSHFFEIYILNLQHREKKYSKSIVKEKTGSKYMDILIKTILKISIINDVKNPGIKAL